MPTAALSESDFVFSFTRRAESTDDTIQAFEYSETLTGIWTSIPVNTPDASEVSIGPVVDGLQTVTVSVSRSLATNHRPFGRLVVEPLGE